MIPAWVTGYVGIPFKANGRDRDGLDCYGALFAVYREVFGIPLPSHVAEYETEADRAELARVLSGHLIDGPWHEVPLRTALRVGDGLLFRIAGEPCHVGVYVGDDRFLHVRPEANACVERLAAPVWARRYLGAYRHEALA